MNGALRGFKKATDQVRMHFAARELISDDVKHLLEHAAPLDNFMRDNTSLTVKSDWSTLRGDLSVLANAYDVAPSWCDSELEKSLTAPECGFFPCALKPEFEQLVRALLHYDVALRIVDRHIPKRLDLFLHLFPVADNHDRCVIRVEVFRGDVLNVSRG